MFYSSFFLSSAVLQAAISNDTVRAIPVWVYHVIHQLSNSLVTLFPSNSAYLGLYRQKFYFHLQFYDLSTNYPRLKTSQAGRGTVWNNVSVLKRSLNISQKTMIFIFSRQGVSIISKGWMVAYCRINRVSEASKAFLLLQDLTTVNICHKKANDCRECVTDPISETAMYISYLTFYI